MYLLALKLIVDVTGKGGRRRRALGIARNDLDAIGMLLGCTAVAAMDPIKMDKDQKENKKSHSAKEQADQDESAKLSVFLVISTLGLRIAKLKSWNRSRSWRCIRVGFQVVPHLCVRVLVLTLCTAVLVCSALHEYSQRIKPNP